MVYEPTGPYHRGVERALAGAGLPLAKVNPRQARRFAEGAPLSRHWSERQWRTAGSPRPTAPMRQALYMPALAAARFNPDLKAKYVRLIVAGKPPKVAITAVMRKLLILANALLRDRRRRTPNLP